MKWTAATERRRLLAAALHAATEQGFHLIPLDPGAKTPAVRKWQERATQDPKIITRWYAKRSYNIGIDTGRSGLVVVDLDVGPPAAPPSRWAGIREGWDVLAQLAADAGQAAPDQTYTVRTPGGTHLYFRAPEGTTLRNTIGKLGWHVDTRAAGGYVVAAGSQRPEGRYRVVNDIAIAPLPDWLTALLLPPPPPSPPNDTSSAPCSTSSYVNAAVVGECRDVANAQPGTRHHTLLRASRILGEFVGAGVLDLTDARVALHHAAARHVGIADCTAREVDRTITDGLAYGQQRPRRLTS